MSIDEILEVIREWIRQYQDLSKTYRWIQVIFLLLQMKMKMNTNLNFFVMYSLNDYMDNLLDNFC